MTVLVSARVPMTRVTQRTSSHAAIRCDAAGEVGWAHDAIC
jgi:hypothetical protein